MPPNLKVSTCYQKVMPSLQLDIQTHNSYSSIQVNNDNDSFGNDTNINKNSKNNKGNKLGLPSKLNETFSQQSK